MPLPKPWFAETNLIDGWPNWQPRNGVKPRLFILHTSEGAGGLNLVNYMRGAEVSYHYVVGNDGIVYDLVDTDDASWSVLDANNYSINLVFGPSFAKWTRQQWIDLMGNAIRIAAYLAVQDCTKYGMSTVVNGGPIYKKASSCITDHRYVTKMLGIGTHTDVGDGFPWDVFADHVRDFTGEVKPSKRVPDDLTDRELLVQIWDQLRGPGGKGWPQLGDRTLVDAVAELLKRGQ